MSSPSVSPHAVQSDYLAANLRALEAAQPGFALPAGPATVSFSDGAWRLTADGRTVALHGRHPEREADDATGALLAASTPKLLIAVGLGAGFLLDSLERRGWEGKVLALEPAPATVAALLARRDWQPWIQSDRLRVLAGPDYGGASDCWRWFTDGVEPAVFVNRLFRHLDAHGVEQARALIRRLRSDAESNAEARRAHGSRYLLNTLRNLRAIAVGTSADRLTGTATGRPAIVVGAGPSLDRALPVLRQLRDRAVIIAVDTALRPLLAAGVTPHAVVVVDPSSANARHLLDLPPCPETCLVTEGSIDTFALSAFADRTFFFAVSEHEPWPWLREHGHGAGKLRAWGSVLTTALDLAIAMDASPIAFVGSDLAYTDGRPYARGVTFEEDWYGQERWGTSFIRQWKLAINHQPEVVEQDVLSAAPVRTAPHLVSFRNWIVDRTRLEQGRTFINATGAGTLRAEHITQVAPEALPDHLTAPAEPVGDLVRRRLQPGTVERLAGQARALLDGAADGDAAANTLLTRWMQFAPGLTRDALLQALEAGVAAAVSKPEPDCRVGSTVLTAAHAESTEMDWLRLLAWHVPRTAMTLPKDRLLTNPEGVAVFRFRTAAARVMCAAIPLPEDALAENGTPLRRAWDLAAVDAGSYAWFRDEIRFRTTDGSDPRWNGHHYSLLVPTAVAHLEGLPLTDILDQRL